MIINLYFNKSCPHSENVMDVVKSTVKKLSVPTDNSVRDKKVAKSDVKEKATGHSSREIQSGKLMVHSHWIFVCFSVSCSWLKLI